MNDESGKSILVIDTPNTCDDCNLCYWADGRFRTCGINYMEVSKLDVEYMGKSKPDWCPLRPLPDKIAYISMNAIYGQEKAYRYGWNNCIDIITGEKNEE